MDPEDKEKLNRNLTKLASKTKWSKSLEQYLVDNNVFSQKLLDVMLASNDASARSRQLFLDVQKRGPRAMERLVKSLVESDNFEAAKVLDPTLPKPRQPAGQQLRESKVWNDPMYEKPVPPPLSLPPNYEEAPTVDSRTPISVRVKRADSWKGPPQHKAYPMRRSPRGMALIIDNEDFDNDVMPKREGSHLDSNNLDLLLEGLGFKVIVHRNLTYREMTTQVVAFSGLEDHAKADMCIVCILSHGDSGLIFSSDNRQVPTEWLLRQFNNEGCPALKGKPKFFILQACRGDETDFGYVPRIDMPEGHSLTATDAQKVTPRPIVRKDLTWEDMLIAYATIPGFVANRNLYRGTWFIESICKVFMEHAKDMNIREMLDEVSEEMRHYESEYGTKQSCCVEVRHFYKKLFFNPGLSVDDDHEDAIHEADVTK